MSYTKKLGLFIFLLILIIPSVSAQIDLNHMEYLSVAASNGTTSVATGDYSGAINNFSIQPPVGETWYISRLIISIEDTGAGAANQYGFITLTNGYNITYANNPDELLTSNQILTVTDIGHHSYDVIKLDFGSGNAFSILSRWTFTKAGTYLKLNGTLNDSINIQLNDDFTGLSDHVFTFQGFKLNSSRVSKYPEDNMDTTTAFGISFFGLLFVFSILLLIGAMAFAYFKNWPAKLISTGFISLVLLYLIRFLGWSMEIINPAQTELIATLSHVYGVSVYVLKGVIYISVGAALLLGLLALKDVGKKKSMGDLDEL